MLTGFDMNMESDNARKLLSNLALFLVMKLICKCPHQHLEIS